MPQYWSVDSPCAYCPAISNTTHDETCQNNIYDHNGKVRPLTKPDSEQLHFDFEVQLTPRKKRRT